MQIDLQRKLLEDRLQRPVHDSEVAEALQVPTAQLRSLLRKSEAAKELMTQANMRLVLHIARFYRNRGVAFPDLVQEGTFGLIKAVEKFNPEKGFRFSTYASWWIKQTVSRSVADKSRLVRVPVHIHDMMVSVGKVEKTFMSSFGRKPTQEELATRLGLPLAKVQLVQRCSKGLASSDENVYQNRGKMNYNEVQVKDNLVSAFIGDPAEINKQHALRHDLRRVLSSLTQREAEIVNMRFGLSDSTPLTLEDIGNQFNVTRYSG